MPNPPKGIIGITGTPGTGKKSVSPIVAEGLGLPCISLNGFAKSKGLIGKGGTVDTGRLKRAAKDELDGPAVVFGHLLPHSFDPVRVRRVVVLRCEPSVLKLRLEARGYPRRKVDENVEAELIGSVHAEAVAAFGRRKVSEVDATGSRPAVAAAEALSLIRGRVPRRAPIDWIPLYGSGLRLRSLVPSG